MSKREKLIVAIVVIFSIALIVLGFWWLKHCCGYTGN